VRGTETHTVTFMLTEEERFIAPAGEFTTYRGRSADTGLTIKVSYITVDLEPGETYVRVKGEGAAVLVNGETSGYGHEAALTEEQKQFFYDEALKVIKANKVQEQEASQS
jgi:hypothetical protein